MVLQRFLSISNSNFLSGTKTYEQVLELIASKQILIDNFVRKLTTRSLSVTASLFFSFFIMNPASFSRQNVNQHLN